MSGGADSGDFPAPADDERLRRGAQLLVALRRACPRPVSLPAELAPRSEAEAYRLQRATAHALGARIGGWKVAMNDPISGSCAPVYAADLQRSPACAAFPITARPGIEPEIAFSLAHDLPPLAPGQRYGRAQVMEAIGAAHAAIEIVVSRFQSHEGAALLDRLADNISNGGLVVGPPCRDWRRLELGALALRLTLQASGAAASVHEARGGHSLGDPLLPLLWLANQRAQHGAGLRAGEIVTTGSCAGLHYAASGARVSAWFEGLGSAELVLG